MDSESSSSSSSSSSSTTTDANLHSSKPLKAGLLPPPPSKAAPHTVTATPSGVRAFASGDPFSAARLKKLVVDYFRIVTTILWVVLIRQILLAKTHSAKFLRRRNLLILQLTQQTYLTCSSTSKFSSKQFVNNFFKFSNFCRSC